MKSKKWKASSKGVVSGFHHEYIEYLYNNNLKEKDVVHITSQNDIKRNMEVLLVGKYWMNPVYSYRLFQHRPRPREFNNDQQ